MSLSPPSSSSCDYYPMEEELGDDEMLMVTDPRGLDDDVREAADSKSSAKYVIAPETRRRKVGSQKYDGAVCRCCGIGWINSAFCGCTLCARKDKVMISALTVIIMLLMLAVIFTELAEVSALANADGNTENAITVTSSFISLFRIAFSFLSYGTLSMIGNVRTHDPSEEAQKLADRRTGKIVQFALIVACSAGVFSTVVLTLAFPAFIRNVVNKGNADIDIGYPYLLCVAPSLSFVFMNNVLKAFCLQTGHILLVVADSFIDLIVFGSLVLGWAATGPSDEIVLRLGITHLVTVMVRFLIYALFCFRPSFMRQFALNDWHIPPEMRQFVNELSADVFWQGTRNAVQAATALVFLSFANQIGEVDALSYNAGRIAIALLAVPSSVLAYFITFFGSRFLGDNRVTSFWGLYKCTSIWIVMMTALTFSTYNYFADTAVSNVSNETNEKQIHDIFTSGTITLLVVLTMIFNNFSIYYQSIFVALHRFKTICMIFSVATLCFGLPVAAIGRARGSFSTLMLGAFMIPDVVMGLSFTLLWHYREHPEQRRKHVVHIEAVARGAACDDPSWMELHEALGWPDLEDLFVELRGETAADDDAYDYAGLMDNTKPLL